MYNNYCVNLIGTESRYVKAMGEVAAMDDSAALMNTSSSGANWDAHSKHRRNMGVNGRVFCCYDNHIGSCNPGSEKDDHYCNYICKKHHCYKGGICKIRGKKFPNHFCHCFC